MVHSGESQGADGIGVGGYDLGYASTPLFWLDRPASLVESTFRSTDLTGKRVLDLGCGEGKNAAFLARLGAAVRAIDVSGLALKNAARRWDTERLDIQFELADVRTADLGAETYDIVISYGLLHCLGGYESAVAVATATQDATTPGGMHVVCALNNRRDGFSEGHIGFRPTLLSHNDYLSFYSDWQRGEATDRDLEESHPPNFVSHTHAVTRFTATKP